MSNDHTETNWVEWSNWILAGLLVFILGAYVQRYLNPSKPGQLVGSQAPAMALASARGDGGISLDDYRGEVVVLDFWATWCGVCARQMPELKKLMGRPEIADKATLVLVNTSERGAGATRRQKVRRYLEERELDFPTALDDGSAARAFRVQGLPTLVVIGPNGDVTYADSGRHSAREIARRIDEASRN